jgi:MFS family permease
MLSRFPKHARAPRSLGPTVVQLGLRENRHPFALLVLINGLVGAMLGLERSVFPQFARESFGLESTSAALSFIAVFGLTKAAANYASGIWAQRWGRKNVLLAGWLTMLPVPFLLYFAPTWSVVLAANALLGLGQGLAWSSTVVMKIDLVGARQRGKAMGINEFAGYFAVGAAALFSAWWADAYGVRSVFLWGAVLAAAGTLLTFFWVGDTRAHAALEARMLEEAAAGAAGPVRGAAPRAADQPDAAAAPAKAAPGAPTRRLFWSVSFAGFANNLNDGLLWGLFPILLLNSDLSASARGLLIGLYPAVWGLGQLFTGSLGDQFPKRRLLAWGMGLQGVVLVLLPLANTFWSWAAASVLLGLGTALVYPTFLSAVADATPPQERSERLGTFRLVRDLGYVAGAIASGYAADNFGLSAAVVGVGVLTLVAAAPFVFNKASSSPVPARGAIRRTRGVFS